MQTHLDSGAQKVPHHAAQDSSAIIAGGTSDDDSGAVHYDSALPPQQQQRHQGGNSSGKQQPRQGEQALALRKPVVEPAAGKGLAAEVERHTCACMKARPSRQRGAAIRAGKSPAGRRPVHTAAHGHWHALHPNSASAHSSNQGAGHARRLPHSRLAPTLSWRPHHPVAKAAARDGGWPFSTHVGLLHGPCMRL